MSEQCYWCGNPANSREHVPSDCLFPPGKRVNLITVPSCPNHNQNFQTFDEKFRVFLQGRGTNADAVAQFQDKTLRGLTRPQSKRFVTTLAAQSHRVTVEG